MPCITAAAAGAAVGWSAVFLCALLAPSARRVGGLALFSSCFTLLLVAHAFAYVRRHRRARAGKTH